MAGLPIPGDWNEETDGYCQMSLDVPNSPRWKAHMRGAIYALSTPIWDDDTGDEGAAMAIAGETYQTIVVNCETPPSGNPDIPICVVFGAIVSANNGVYEINAIEMSGEFVIWVKINHECDTYGDNQRPEISIESQNFIPYDPDEAVMIYNRSDGPIDQLAEPVTNYCNVNLGSFDMWSGEQPFSITLIIGDVCN